MPLVGFEPTISAGERPQTYALDCAATGTGEGVQYENVPQVLYDRNSISGRIKDFSALQRIRTASGAP
jgi:hypothetical protein